jgi:hypothetical protein
VLRQVTFRPIGMTHSEVHPAMFSSKRMATRWSCFAGDLTCNNVLLAEDKDDPRGFKTKV